MNLQSQINVWKIVQNEQKWPINVSEEPDARNDRLDTGTSLK